MTEKRFTLKGYDGIRCDLFDGDVELAEVHKEDAKELCNLLNELHEENEQLKQENKELEKFRYNVFKRIGEIND